MKRLMMALVLTGAFAFGAGAQSMGTSYKTALGVKVWDCVPNGA